MSLLNKKHIFYCVACLFLALNGLGQAGFNNYYQSGRYSFGNRMLYTSPNEFILSSYYQDSVIGQQGLDLKIINNQGVVIKRKRYLFANDFMNFLTSANVQTSISNSTLLYTGASYVDTASAVIFVSINKNTLDTNWARYYYDGIYNYYINNVFKTKPNEVWYIGNRFNNYGYNLRPVVFKTDTLGNILSIKEFNNLVNYQTACICYDAQTSLLYMAGTDVTSPAAQKGFVACVDTTGNVLWNQIIGGNSNSASYFYQVEQKNNYLVLSGAKIIYVLGNSYYVKPTLIKVNKSNGGLIWQKTYGEERQGNELTNFIINNDESIVAAGEIELAVDNNTAIDRNGIILKTNSNGDSLWLKSYSNYTGNVYEIFYDVQASQDGGYVLCGSPINASNARSWIVKTDSLGNGPGVVVPSTITAVSELTGESRLNLYPNPASNQVMIQADFEALNSGPVKLMIYNAAGELIKEEEPTFKNKRTTLKTNELQNGIYFVKLQCDNKIFVRKLVIVK